MENFNLTTSEGDSSVELEANYEGSDSLATIDRARDSIIHDQIVEMLRTQEILKVEAIKNEEWESHLPEGWTGEERFKLFKGKHTGRVMDSEDLDATLRKPISTKEEIAKDLNTEIEHVATVTEIEFSSDQPTAERMTTAWEVPLTGKKLTVKQMSIAEAHEKGHRIRPYHNELLPIFMRAFDPSKVEFTEADYKVLEHLWTLSAAEGAIPSREKLKDDYLNSYLFTPSELAERMSQLKNYFGMRGHEPFTREHLKYAREHYVADIGIDNAMRLFFDAITPETEGEFIHLMNSAGI